jgi:hypothetical protein
MLANPAAPPTSPPAEGAVPDWFARGRIARGVRTATEAEQARDETPAGDKNPVRRLALWVAGGSAVGYAISLVVHSLVLLAFSLIALQIGKGAGGGTLDTTLGVPGATGDELLDTRSFEISAGSEAIDEAVAVAEPLPVDAPSLELAVANDFDPKTPGAADGTGEDDKSVEGSGDGDDGAFELPAGGGNAVREGSFAAWTVPEDPQPQQNYMIVIEVTLPKDTERYTKADLSGQLVGTDGYRVRIPDGTEFNGQGWIRPMRTPAFRRAGDKARVVFFIRGAQQALVRDTILIRSRLLDEQQKLQITF